MTTTIQPIRLNHMNLVLRDASESVQHFQKTFDADLVADMPNADYDACLVATGGVLFEFFFPKVYLLNSRYGPHYVGVEYRADMGVVCQAVAEREMRIIREVGDRKNLAVNPGYALHTHPDDGFGVSYEFYHDDFHQWTWPLLGGRIKPAEQWRSHPLPLTGQKGYTHAVADIEGASGFLQSFLGAEPIHELERPEIGARAVGLQVADVVVELLTPTGDGELARHLYRYGDGIRSTVFGVADLDQARRYFEERGQTVRPGYAPGSIALEAEANLGVLFEFSE